jgi:hypothetical protein
MDFVSVLWHYSELGDSFWIPIERMGHIKVIGRLTNDFYVKQNREGILIPLYP